jgi:hypothetical protein
VFLLLPVVLLSAIIPDVSVVDVVNGLIEPHQDIVIRGDRIAAVRPAATRVRETRFVIPGLWDMHVQLGDARPPFPFFLAHGVTGIRDMGTDLKRVRGWEPGGPRIYASGLALSAATPDAARRMFNLYYDARVDFIQIGDLPEPAFEALAEASRHGGLPFAGDLPDSISASSAARDRMVSMEHLIGIALACSSKETELRNKLVAARAANERDAVSKVESEIIDTYDAVAARDLWDLFRRYDVRQTPVLTGWSGRTGAEFASRLTGDMAKAGVPILAGAASGFALQDELELLVKAGLTPLEALRAATYEPARLMHRQSTFGQIRKGYAADLVVLGGNPLANIGNTRRIETVFLRGRIVKPGPSVRGALSGAAAASGSLPSAAF